MSTRAARSDLDAPLVVAIGELMQDMCRANGVRHVVDGSRPGALLDRDGRVKPKSGSSAAT